MAGQAHEVNQIQHVLNNIFEIKTLVTDRAYDADFVINFLHQKN